MPSAAEAIREDPRYPHDCTQCFFLGTWDGHDLYHCPTSFGGTLLARCGGDAHAYASISMDIMLTSDRKWGNTSHPALLVALAIARLAGCIPEDE
jgi:hypothetical protein